MLHVLSRRARGSVAAGFCSLLGGFALTALSPAASAQTAYSTQALTAAVGGSTFPLQPLDVNERGQVLGQVFTAPFSAATFVLWEAGAAQAVALPDNFSPVAFNDAGWMVGSSALGPALWRGGVLQALGLPALHSADVTHIANDGTVSGVLYGVTQGPRGPIRTPALGTISWQAAEPGHYITSPLRTLNFTCSASYTSVLQVPNVRVVEGIGQAAEGCLDLNAGRAFAALRSAGGTVVDLNTLAPATGAHLDGVAAMSERGWIAAVSNSTGAAAGVLLQPSPEPAPLPTRTLRVTAASTRVGGVPGVLVVLVDGVVKGSWALEDSNYLPYDLRLPRLAGGEALALAFINDAFDATSGADRNVFIRSIELDGQAIATPGLAYQPDVGAAQAFRGVMPWNGRLSMTAPAPVTGGDTLVVRARSSLVAGVGARMDVRVDNRLVTTVDVAATAMTDFRVPLGVGVKAGTRIDLVFTNDAYDASTGADRNLYVERLSVSGRTLQATEAGVVYDIGTGAAAFDGLATRAGQGVLPWAGALRFTLP